MTCHAIPSHALLRNVHSRASACVSCNKLHRKGPLQPVHAFTAIGAQSSWHLHWPLLPGHLPASSQMHFFAPMFPSSSLLPLPPFCHCQLTRLCWADAEAQGGGELGRLQAQTMRAPAVASAGQQQQRRQQQPIQACLAALAMRQATVKDQERTDAELKLAQALALGSPVEYRRWLATYARTLARAWLSRACNLLHLAGFVARKVSGRGAAARCSCNGSHHATEIQGHGQRFAPAAECEMISCSRKAFSDHPAHDTALCAP